MRKGKRGQKVIPSANRGALNPKDRLRQQAYGLRNTRNFAQAKPLLEELYKLEPDNMPLALDLGEAYMETEDFGSATSLYAKLIEKDPKNINAVTNLGGSLIRQGKLSDARSILQYALELDPKSIHARINLGSVLQASGERKANLDNALEAVQIDPSSSLAFNNLGSAFSDMAMFKEARHAYETAVMLDPDQVDALINLAAVEARLGDSKASAEMYERVIKKLPKEGEQRIEATKFYAAFEYLKQGNLEKGWDYYEGGFSPLVPATGARSPRRTFDVPRWEGQPLNGRTLLVWREQGLGDELLFYTCLHELKEMGGKVIVECDKRLVEVMARSFPEFTVRAELFMPQKESRSPVEDFDCHLPAGSLMRYFRPTIESFNRSGAYIKPDPAKVAKFAERLAPYKDDYRLVGICWRSGKLDPVRNLSYTMLDEWGEVLKTPGFKFVNLQYGECEAELKEAEGKYGIEILRWSDLNLRNDLDDIFALMTCLDAVASVQTAVLTMSGAVGTSTLGIKAGGWTSLGRKRASPWFSLICFAASAEKAINKFEDINALRMLKRLIPSSIEIRTDKLLSEQVKEISAEDYSFLLDRIASHDDSYDRGAGGIDGLTAVLKQGLWSHYEVTRPVAERVVSSNIVLKGLAADARRYDLAMSVAKAAASQGDWEVFSTHLKLAEELNSGEVKKELPEFAWRSFLDGQIDQAREFATQALEHFYPSQYIHYHLPRVIAECGNTEAAIELANIVTKQDPKCRGVYAAIAKSLFQDGRFQDAVDLITQEETLGPLKKASWHEKVVASSYLESTISLQDMLFNDYDNKYSGFTDQIGVIASILIDRVDPSILSDWCKREADGGRSGFNNARYSLFGMLLHGTPAVSTRFDDLDCRFSKLETGRLLSDLALFDFSRGLISEGLEKLRLAEGVISPGVLLMSANELLDKNYKQINNKFNSFFRRGHNSLAGKNSILSLLISDRAIHSTQDDRILTEQIQMRRIYKGGLLWQLWENMAI